MIEQRSAPPAAATATPVPQQRRDRQQHPVQELALGPAQPRSCCSSIRRTPPGTPPPAVRARRRNGRQLLLQLVLQPLTVLLRRPPADARRRAARRRARRRAAASRARVAERQPSASGRQPPRPAEVPARPAAPPARAAPGSTPSPHQRLDDERLGQRRERDDLAPREHGVRQLVGRADSSRNTASAGGSSSTFSSTSAAAVRSRSASRTTMTLRPGSGGVEVRRAPDRAVAGSVSTWMSRPSGSSTNMFGWWSSQRQAAVAALAAPAVADTAAPRRTRAAASACPTPRAGEQVRVVRALERAGARNARGLVLPRHVAARPGGSPGRRPSSSSGRVRPSATLQPARRSQRRRATPLETSSGVPVGVDDHEPLGMLLRDLQVRVGHLRVEVAPSSSIRSGASVDRSRPSSGSRCSRITRSGNSPCVAHAFSVRMSCSPSPRATPGTRPRSRRTGRTSRPCPRPAPGGSPSPRAARGVAANSSASARASSLPVVGSRSISAAVRRTRSRRAPA